MVSDSLLLGFRTGVEGPRDGNGARVGCAHVEEFQMSGHVFRCLDRLRNVMTLSRLRSTEHSEQRGMFTLCILALRRQWDVWELTHGACLGLIIIGQPLEIRSQLEDLQTMNAKTKIAPPALLFSLVLQGTITSCNTATCSTTDGSSMCVGLACWA